MLMAKKIIFMLKRREGETENKDKIVVPCFHDSYLPLFYAQIFMSVVWRNHYETERFEYKRRERKFHYS